MPPPTAIQRYDLVILGGGIAGCAIAEFLGRRTTLRIKLIEPKPQLGAGASGKLEGWFHAGALYSGHDDAQTFLNCVNGIEDLINLYSGFFSGRCNLVLADSGARSIPAVVEQPEGWFNDAPVHFLLPNADAPELRQSRLRQDAVIWEIQRQRVLNRLEAAFGGGHDWRQDGRCQAPSLGQIEAYEARGTHAGGLIDRSGRWDDLCARYDQSFNEQRAAYDVVRSLDVSMNTSRILRDLVASACASGVEFETGLTVEDVVIDRFGPVRVNSIRYRDEGGALIHLKAGQFVFAVGGGFKGVLDRLGLRVRLKQVKSSMVVATPALLSLNFARMSIKQRFHFNHLAQRDAAGGWFSLLANSGFVGGDEGEPADDVDRLLDLAERYFGRDALYGRRLYTYDCSKTEFISDEEEKRRYSYWIEAAPGGNFVCVLPGKFSFFPTVAYQTLLRLKVLLGFADAPRFETFAPAPRHEQAARRLVAEYYPAQVLGGATGERRGRD